MYSGQSSRTIRPKSDVKDIISFHVGNCVIASPDCTPSLFFSFLNLAKQDHTLSIEKRYIRATLLKTKNNGSSRSALRIIILKVVELLDGSKDNLQKWNEGMTILREVISVAREVFDELSFASFFLSVGRQLEPHQFDLIFPLPTEGGTGISAEDLFTVAVKKGSMSVALSGLSLFSCHQATQKRVVQLLCHCLFKIDEIFALSTTSSCEEEKYLHQLYWFGVKLEDAIIAEKAQELTNMFDTIDSGESAIMSNSSTSFDESSIGYASNGDYSVESSEDFSSTFHEENQDASFISCRSQNRKPREGLVTKVVSRLFQSSRFPNNSFEEDAIYEAATSFIISGFNYDEKALTVVEANGTCTSETNHDGNDTFDKPSLSVTGSTSIFLCHAIGLNCEQARGGWKIASTIAYLIQGDRETLAISDAAASNAVGISQLVSVDELRDFCTFDHRIYSESASQQAHIVKVVSFLEHLTSHCCDQMHSDAVESILNLVLLLLLRHDACEDVQHHRGGLILIGIVCGQLSGRITDFIDLSQECDVTRVYQAFTQKND